MKPNVARIAAAGDAQAEAITQRAFSVGCELAGQRVTLRMDGSQMTVISHDGGQPGAVRAGAFDAEDQVLGAEACRPRAALYRAVIVRMQHHEPTRAYVARRTAEGKTKGEIIRCLNACSPGRPGP